MANIAIYDLQPAGFDLLSNFQDYMNNLLHRLMFIWHEK
jgi:hypothetical protein